MGLNNKKYLDYAGLEKLVDMHAVVPHPQVEITEEGAYKLAFDEHGHIVSKSPLTAGDLKLDKAMHFVGKSTTDPATGTVTIDGLDEAHQSGFHPGDVCIYLRDGETGFEEYVYTGTAWELIGDASSYVLKDIEINGDGTYILGGGDLSEDRTLSHKTYTAAEAAIKAIGRDAGGHVVIGKEILVQASGGHDHGHATSTPIAKDTYVTEAAGATTKLSITSSKATVLTDIEDTSANLDTTSIRGVSGTTKVSKATAGTEITVATTGTNVTGLAKRADSATVYGTANVKSTGTQVASGDVTSVSAPKVNVTKAAYNADYEADDECLILSPITITAEAPTVVLAKTEIHEAVAAPDTQKLWAVQETTASVTPAVANGKITPYTFTEIDVATANAAATTVATGSVSTSGAGATIMTSIETTNTEVLNSATIASGATGDVDVVYEVTTAKNDAVTFAGTAEVHIENGHIHRLYTE